MSPTEPIDPARALDAPAARAYLAAHPDLAAILGGDPQGWAIREASDGFLNVVFLVQGRDGGLCLKQALPWVRHAGESWPLPATRAYFEQSYLTIVGPLAEGALPTLRHYDPSRQILAMDYLSPHETLRYALIAGRRFPRVSVDIGAFVARACYRSSAFCQPLERFRDWQARFATGVELQRITLDLIFQDAYRDNPRSSWTSPQLDDLAHGFRRDLALKRAAGRLAHRFLTTGQALIHGDLHTAAIMVTETDTKVIDPEFALYGPIGFDLGAYLANILISHLTQPAHATPGDDRIAMADWLLEQPQLLWDSFSRIFRDLWDTGGGGDAYHDDLFAKPGSAAILRPDHAALEAEIFADMVGFAALKMIRRVFSYAHVADFLRIADPDRRAACERRTVLLARRLLTEPGRFRTPGDIVAATRAA